MTIEELRVKFHRAANPIEFKHSGLPSAIITDNDENVYLILNKDTKKRELNCLPLSTTDFFKIKESEIEENPGKFKVVGKINAVV